MGLEKSRRDFLRNLTVTSASIGSLSSVSTAQTASDASWPQFANNAANTGFAENSDVSGSSPSRQWTLSASNPVTSGISFVDDAVYFTDSVGRLYQVTTDGQTEVFEQGTRLQGASDNLEPTSTPLIDSGSIYFGGLSGDVVSIDLSTGEQQWSYETDDAVRSSLTLFNGNLIFGDILGNIYAIDPSSGEETARPGSVNSLFLSPVLIDDSAYFAAQNGSVFEYNGGDSDVSRISTLESNISAAPVADGERLFIASDDGQISARRSGTEYWNTTVGGTIAATPSITDGVLYLGTQSGRAIALDAEDSNQLWETTIDGGVQRGVAVTDNTVVCGTDTGMLYGINSDDGETRWEFELGTEITTPISIVDSVIYCGGASGQLFAVSAEGSVITSLANGVQSGDISQVRESISQVAPPEVQGLVGVGAAGTATYYTAGWLKNRRNHREEVDTTSTKPPTSLSGEANPIDETTHSSGTQLDIGDVNYNDFEQIESIGTGGNADVYKARLREGDSTFVALKIPRSAGSDTIDTSSFSNFTDEAEVWDGIDDHERIVSVYCWGGTPLPWIAIEYMDSGDLSQQDFTHGKMFAELEGLAEGLHHAHRHGVTHTDIKPENILYADIGGEKIGKLTDWGLANVLLEHSMSVDGLTPSYSAPEQFRPEKYGGTDERTDIYQLGVVAYELFTGKLPFEASSQGEGVMAVLNEEPQVPSSINPELTEAIDTVLLKVLSKEKEHRYETALHFRDDLRRAHNSIS